MESKITLAKAIKRLNQIEEQFNIANSEHNSLVASLDSKLDSALAEQRNAFEQKKELLHDKIRNTIETERNEIIEIINTESNPFSFLNDILQEDKLINYIFSFLTETQAEEYQPSYYFDINQDNIDDYIKLLKTYISELPKNTNDGETKNNNLFQLVYNAVDESISKLYISFSGKQEEPENEAKTPKSKKNDKYSYALKQRMPTITIFIVTLILALKFSSILFLVYFFFGLKKSYDFFKLFRFLNLYANLNDLVFNSNNKNSLVTEDILSQVDAFLATSEEIYNSKINNITYKEDHNKIEYLKTKLEEEIKNSNVNILRLKQDVDNAKKEVERIKAELERMEMDKLTRAKTIEEEYLTYSELNWQEHLPKDIYLGKNKKGDPVLFPVEHNNILFISNEIHELFDFTKLFIMQLLMKVHPDYVSQVVLDYKYMSGNLQQFLNIPPRSLTILMEKQKIEDKLQDINIDVLARNRNILKSVNSLEEFNTLMKSYNSVGECYVFIHIFGLQQLHDTYTYLLRNGSKVGYYFYIYLTLEEFKSLKSEEILDLVSLYYFIGDLPGIGIYPDKRLRMVMSSYLTTK